jgi:hypothetical protein
MSSPLFFMLSAYVAPAVRTGASRTLRQASVGRAQIRLHTSANLVKIPHDLTLGWGRKRLANQGNRGGRCRDQGGRVALAEEIYNNYSAWGVMTVMTVVAEAAGSRSREQSRRQSRLETPIRVVAGDNRARMYAVGMRAQTHDSVAGGSFGDDPGSIDFSWPPWPRLCLVGGCLVMLEGASSSA